MKKLKANSSISPKNLIHHSEVVDPHQCSIDVEDPTQKMKN